MKVNQKFINIVYKGLLICSVWFVVALLVSSLTILTQLRSAESESWSILTAIAFEVICISPWAISTPLIIWITRHYLLGKDNIYVSLSTQLVTALFVFIFHSFIQSYAASVFYDFPLTWEYFKVDFVTYLDMRVMLYIGVVLSAYAIDYQKKIRESTLKEPRLKAQLNKARYQALLNQIQPRFLLSSIGAIRENIRSNPRESEEILTDFSDLLRLMLKNANKELITLQEDLKSYCLYSNLIQKRLRKKIEIKAAIDERFSEALVPSFLMFISLFEAFIFDIQRDTPAIKSMSYNATLKNGMMHLEMIIDGIKKPNYQVSKQLQNGWAEDVRENINLIYAKPIRFNAHTDEATMYIKLCVPFKLQEPEVSNEVQTVDTLFTS